MKKLLTMKKYFVIPLLLLFTYCGKEVSDPEQNPPIDETEDPTPDPDPNIGPLGLYVLDGKLTHNEEPFYGVGVNYFDAFLRVINTGASSPYEAGFTQLKNAGIPFVRFMACGFYPNDWNLYLNNKSEYFKRLDKLVETAEQQGIGLIPSLFWNSDVVPDIVGESINNWGKADSETIAFMKNYTKELVTRYRESPAIWGWEFTNEMNLFTDLSSSYRPPIVPEGGTPTFRTADDRLVHQDLEVAVTAFAETVRLYDNHRIIITGNSAPRRDAHRRARGGSGSNSDTKAQYVEMLGRQNPDPVNTFSIHIYPSMEEEGNGGYFRSNGSMHEIIQTSMDASSDSGKPLFLGEFGAPIQLGSQEAVKFQQLLDAIETLKVPLSALWVYNYSLQNADWNVTFNNSRQYQLDLISQLNKRLP